jgi:hypothetical protein
MWIARIRSVVMATLTVLVVGWMAFAAPVEAGVGDYTCNSPSKVYYGNQRLFQRPASVDCDRVYARIPEYKQILSRRLTDKDPQYHLLMKKATKRFSAAVQKMARAKNHDLVAQMGAVRKAKDKAKDIPNRTDEVIKALD